jgi:integrase
MAKLRFTTDGILALPTSGNTRTFHHDTETRGLAVRISPNGERIFYLYRKVKGHPVKIALGRFDPSLPASQEIPRGTNPKAYLGTSPALNVRMARGLAAAVNVELDQGINPAANERGARRVAREELTLRQAFERYYNDHLVPNGKRTAEELRGDFDRYLGKVDASVRRPRGREKQKPACCPNWEDRKLSAIHKEDVERALIDMRRDLSARTANKLLELLRAIYKKCNDWRLYAGDNPCEGVKKFPIQSRSRFLKSEELPRFFDALTQVDDVAFRHFVMLLLATGARRSNVEGMRWSDIDFVSAHWVVPGEKSKNGDPLTLPLTTIAIQILSERRGVHSTWVFPSSRSASGHVEDYRKPWSALLEKAGLDDVRLHDLRRSLGSWAAMTGASLTIIGAALGHRSHDATSVYARLQIDPVREALEKAQAAMFSHSSITS